MDKAQIKKGMSILVVLLCGFSHAQAQGQLDATGPTQAEAAQFQDWLKNNGQGSLASVQPSASQPTSAPPLQIIQDVPSSPPPIKRKLTQQPPLTYDQSQQVILNSIPVSPTSSESEAAFNNMMQQNMPLTPQQVVRLKQLIDQSQRAAAMPANVPPKPVSSTLMVNLAPGATPPAIRLAQGYVTSLVFVDSTGQPWPLASYDIGDPKTTNIQWDGKSNVVLIQASAPYGDSDLVVRLVGMATPITLELVLGQRVVDYRTDIHVAGLGPNSKDLPTGTGLPNSANQLLLSVLDGVAPPGSKQLVVKGGDCSAWLLGDKMFLRTRLTVLSPGWVGRMVSPDGMYAYEIQRSSSVLVSQYGQPIELKIEGF
jgi:intracellular multiplication protein IcmK